MPRASLPPTPAPSTEIKGKQNQSLDHAEMPFTLPPSAVNNDMSSSASKDWQPQNETLPVSPESPSPSSEQRPKLQHDLSLPPPPSRSRKIIQMKPKSQSSQPRRSARADAQTNDKSSATESSQPASAAGGGKKGGSGNTAAGRKVARKTAHSIIERRRRSKMNEEFGVLKDLIPACRGFEMHKLAILQASIDYLRYLEQCVTDLKANQEQPEQHHQSTSLAPSSMQDSPVAAEESNEDSEDDMELDEPETEPAKQAAERSSSVSSTSAFTATTSPAFSAQSHHRGSIATLPSPVFGPYYAMHDPLRPSTTHSNQSYAGSRASYSTQTSPNIMPLTHDFEHSEDLNEASTALLMLNAKDRRGTVSSLRSTDDEKMSQRIMSVKDLLRS